MILYYSTFDQNIPVNQYNLYLIHQLPQDKNKFLSSAVHFFIFVIAIFDD